MNPILEQALQVRYIKLHFTVAFLEDCMVPVSKTSALRGGIGEMLLRSNCIRERDCENCDFIEECIVHRTMYTRNFSQKPDYVTGGESIGYVLECENYKEQMAAGEEMNFNLTLFGRTIVYFSQYLSAIHALGQMGLGKYEAQFEIVRVTNSFQKDILVGNNVFMKNYQVETLRRYVELRHRKLFLNNQNRIYFKTATTLKYRGEFLQEFQAEAIVEAAKRKLYMLNCFENRATQELSDYSFEPFEICAQSIAPVSVRRYSNRQESAMFLKGIKGIVEIANLPEDTCDLLLAAEIFHIGKNTHFGFGRFLLT